MTTSTRVYIGSRIRAYRKAKGATQASLAEALGCEVTTIGRYERGEYAPDSEQLMQLAEFFNASPMDFLPGELDKKRQEVLDLRAELIDQAYKINDVTQLKKIINTMNELQISTRKA